MGESLGQLLFNASGKASVAGNFPFGTKLCEQLLALESGLADLATSIILRAGDRKQASLLQLVDNATGLCGRKGEGGCNVVLHPARFASTVTISVWQAFRLSRAKPYHKQLARRQAMLRRQLRQRITQKLVRAKHRQRQAGKVVQQEQFPRCHFRRKGKCKHWLCRARQRARWKWLSQMRISRILGMACRRPRSIHARPHKNAPRAQPRTPTLPQACPYNR